MGGEDETMEGGIERQTGVDFLASMDIRVKGCLQTNESLGFLERFVIERGGCVFSVVGYEF